MDDTKTPTFHGYVTPDYPGGPCHGCDPNDKRANSWMAVVGGHIYNLKTAMDVVAG